MLPQAQRDEGMTMGGGQLGQGSKKVNIGGIEIDHEQLREKAKDHFKNKVLTVDDTDRQVWESATNVPRVSFPVAIVCTILNLIIPGLGTLVAACMQEDTVSKTQIAIAFIQFMTAVFLIGFVFACYWSYLIIMKAREDQAQVQRFAGEGGMNRGMGGGFTNQPAMGGFN